jgi:hypothetical protein
MGLNWPKSGPNHVPSFEISGLPYITRSAGSGSFNNEISDSAVKHSFPFVTRFFSIGNPSNGDLRVGFTENGVESQETANYFRVPAHTSASMSTRYEIRCKDLYFRRDDLVDADFEIIAGLTTIAHSQMPLLTGSNDSTKPQGIVWTGIG